MKALLNSLAGLAWAARHEPASRQEIIILAVAAPLSFFVTSENWQRLALIASVVFLLTIEMLNTAIEKLSDQVSPEHSAAIKVVKDLASAAVLLALVLTAATWLVVLGRIFLP